MITEILGHPFRFSPEMSALLAPPLVLGIHIIWIHIWTQTHTHTHTQGVLSFVFERCLFDYFYPKEDP